MVVAVRRESGLILNPGPAHQFEADDIAILVGDPTQVERAMCLLDPACGEPDR